MPGVRKSKGKVRWLIAGQRLLLLRGSGFVLAIWDPTMPRKAGFLGNVDTGGGKIVHYKTWRGWGDKVWAVYKMRPPAGYFQRDPPWLERLPNGSSRRRR